MKLKGAPELLFIYAKSQLLSAALAIVGYQFSGSVAEGTNLANSVRSLNLGESLMLSVPLALVLTLAHAFEERNSE